MTIDGFTSQARRTGARRPENLGRFLIICFFIALVLIVLGIYFINGLFDESKQLVKPQLLTEVSEVGKRAEVKPRSPSDQLRIYYTSDGIRLTPSITPMNPNSRSSRGRQALDTLFRTNPGGALRSPVPPGVEVAAFFIKPGKDGAPTEAVVDLSKEILEQPLGGVGAELLCVYAIVNTVLANTEDAEAVRILVDGKAAPNGTLWGHVDISGALTPGALLSSEPR